MPHASRLICGDFKVEFAAHGGRVGHTIYAATSGGDGGDPARPWWAVLHSIEGDADAAWPDSPPLQELHIERRGGHDVALLVGRAGKSHWSASVGRETDENGRAALAFDVACRAALRPVLLLSAYRLADGVVWMGKAPAPEVDAARWQSIELLRPADAFAWELAVDGPASIVAAPNADRVAIRPASSADVFPATVRWRYLLRKASGSEPQRR